MTGQVSNLNSIQRNTFIANGKEKRKCAYETFSTGSVCKQANFIPRVQLIYRLSFKIPFLFFTGV